MEAFNSIASYHSMTEGLNLRKCTNMYKLDSYIYNNNLKTILTCFKKKQTKKHLTQIWHRFFFLHGAVTVDCIYCVCLDVRSSVASLRFGC